MILHDVQQGSVDWWALRLGLPTASSFDRILTKGGKISAQAEGYRHKLLAEWLIGAPFDDVDTKWMERGRELEPEAFSYYEFQKNAEVRPGGFITSDNGLVGCSPDGMVYEDGKLVGGLELKCPMPEKHMGYLLGGRSVMDAYRHQVQGALLISGLQWWDIMSYNPLLPPAIVRVTPDTDEAYLKSLKSALIDFVDELDACKQDMLKMGYEPRDPIKVMGDTFPQHLSPDDDVPAEQAQGHEG